MTSDIKSLVAQIQHKAAQLEKAENRFATDCSTFNENNMSQTRNALNALALQLLKVTASC